MIDELDHMIRRLRKVSWSSASRRETQSVCVSLQPESEGPSAVRTRKLPARAGAGR